MLTTHLTMGLKTPHRRGFSEAPHADVRPFADRLDIVQPEKQQLQDLCVAGSNPVVEQSPAKAHFNSILP